MLEALRKLHHGHRLERTVKSVFKGKTRNEMQALQQAELFLIETLSDNQPEDFGKDEVLDDILYTTVKKALKKMQEARSPRNDRNSRKRRSPVSTDQSDSSDGETQPKEKKKKETQPRFPVSDKNLDETQIAKNQRTLDEFVQASSQAGETRNSNGFAVQMTGYLSIKAALLTCIDIIKSFLTACGVDEDRDFSINDENGSVTAASASSDESEQDTHMKLLKLAVGVSFDVSQLMTFSTLAHRPAPHNFKWPVVAQMIAIRNVSETTGQNAYSQALEKELKQATKAFPNKSGWNNQRPRNQAAFRQRKNWYRSRNPAGPGRWNGGGLWQGRGGGYGQGRGRGQGGARGGGASRDHAGAGGQ